MFSRMRTARRRGSDVDCADCPAVRRCWGEKLPPGCGILVQRQPRLERGTTLFAQGERFVAIYLVVAGCLTLRETSPDGTERVVGFRVPGELVGLEGWSLGVHSFTATAATAMTVCRLKWPQRERAVASAALLERLLRKSTGQIDACARPWTGLVAVEQVAAFIEDFARRMRMSGERPDERLVLPMTRAEIGSYLGLAEETVVRALAQLRRSGRLDVKGRAVTLSSHAYRSIALAAS